MKRYLIVMQQNPYANSLSMEALEFAFALTAFDQHVALLFRGTAIAQLLQDQPADQIVSKDFTKAYTGLDLFNINEVYVEAAGFTAYANQPLLLQPQVLSEDRLEALFKEFDVIVKV
jgi:sulfur relay protein TusC/DsrF